MKHKFILMGIVAVVIVFVTGFNAVLLFGVWNPFQSSPKELTLSAFEKLERLKTVKIETNILMESKNTDSGEVLFGLKSTLNQIIDAQNKDNPKMKYKVQGEITRETHTRTSERDVIIIGQNAYLRFAKGKELEKLSNSPSIVEALKNQWISVPSLEIKDMPFFQDTQRGQYKAQFLNILKDKGSYGTITRLADENLEGEKMHRYKIMLKMQAFKKLLDTLSGIEKLYDIGGVNDYDFDDAIADLRKADFQSKFEEFPVEIWISSQDAMPRRILLEQKLNSEFEQDSGAKIKENSYLGIDIRLSDFNKVLNIETPADVKTWEEALQVEQQNSPIFASISRKARDAERISNIRMTALILETENDAQPSTFLEGCTKAGANNITACTGPGDINYFKSFADPLNSPEEGLCSASNPQKGCQYAISGKNGTDRPKTNDYQICFYLEEEPSAGIYGEYIKGLQAVKSGQDSLKSSPCTILP